VNIEEAKIQGIQWGWSSGGFKTLGVFLAFAASLEPPYERAAFVLLFGEWKGQVH